MNPLMRSKVSGSPSLRCAIFIIIICMVYSTYLIIRCNDVTSASLQKVDNVALGMKVQPNKESSSDNQRARRAEDEISYLSRQMMQIKSKPEAPQYNFKSSWEFRNMKTEENPVPIRSYAKLKLEEYRASMRHTCDRIKTPRDFEIPCPTPAVNTPRSFFAGKITSPAFKADHSKTKAEAGMLLARGPSFGNQSCDKLLIVQDPDDDAIFAGESLACTALFEPQSCWKVVMVADGGRKPAPNVDYLRVEEFIRHATFMGAEYEMWWYASDQQIKNILLERDWNVILTHGPHGEYGNGAHMAVSSMVRSNLPRWLWNRLYMFDPNPEAPKDELLAPSPLKLLGFREYDSERAALVSLFWWVEYNKKICMPMDGKQNFSSEGLSIHFNAWCEYRSSYCQRGGKKFDQYFNQHTHMMWPIINLAENSPVIQV